MTKELDFTTKNISKLIEEDRVSGKFRRDILMNGPAYQASKINPEMIEEIHPDGTVILGDFQNGEFVPNDEE